MLAAAAVQLDSADSVVVVSVAVVAQVLPQQEPAVLAPPVVVRLVVEPEVPVHLLSRQSFSAAMARTTA